MRDGARLARLGAGTQNDAVRARLGARLPHHHSRFGAQDAERRLDADLPNAAKPKMLGCVQPPRAVASRASC